MSISNIGNRPDQALLQPKQAGDRGRSGISQELREKIAKVETGEPGAIQEEGQQERGVVGLLQEGHFRGVADVRLRINFYEQLQLSLSQKSGEVLKTKSQELMLELEAKVQSFGEEFQVQAQVEDLLTTLREEAGGLFGAENEGNSPIIGGLRDAFAGFLDSLQSLAQADDAEKNEGESGVAGEESLAATETTVVEGDAPVRSMEVTEKISATTAEPDAFSAALQNLQEWFDAEIAVLEKTVNDLQTLPDPSEPRGNGVAYDHFLGIYRDLEAGTGSTRTHGKA